MKIDITPRVYFVETSFGGEKRLVFRGKWDEARIILPKGRTQMIKFCAGMLDLMVQIMEHIIEKEGRNGDEEG